VELTRRRLLDLLDSNRIRPSKALGQHFVADPNTVRRIVRTSGVSEGDLVLEVGAGLGSLTLGLAEAGARVTAVEVDRRLAAPLRQAAEPAGVRVIEADALGLDWRCVLGEGGRWVVVSNLPYNVSTPLVVRLLEEAPAVSRMLVMVQRETGERLAARVGEPAYGAVSVKVSYWARASLAGAVSANVFVPRPNVESVLVRMERRERPAVAAGVPYDELFGLVRAGFAQRRKMLRRSLAGIVPEEAFGAAGVRPEARAEELAIEDWGRLTEWVLRTSGRSPS
jgi:16S rRNA (adenine1518-N6/adenine1519-N6)-dimethyltransferase